MYQSRQKMSQMEGNRQDPHGSGGLERAYEFNFQGKRRLNYTICCKRMLQNHAINEMAQLSATTYYDVVIFTDECRLTIECSMRGSSFAAVQHVLSRQLTVAS
jgi:hypothetical protein